MYIYIYNFHMISPKQKKQVQRKGQKVGGNQQGGDLQSQRGCLNNDQEIPQKVSDTPCLSDEQFYSKLKLYQPMCYNGQGIPIFMKNKEWYYSLPCIFIMGTLLIIGLLVYLSNISKKTEQLSQSPYYNQLNSTTLIIINLSILLTIFFFYFLTQFMNPGIINFSKISKKEYEKHGKFYCIRCDGYRTGEMNHCTDCEVCIWNMDHHCGFFNKCIAGRQVYAFYGFISAVFGGFLCLAVTLLTTLF